jgi:hypothetical protein
MHALQQGLLTFIVLWDLPIAGGCRQEPSSFDRWDDLAALAGGHASSRHLKAESSMSVKITAHFTS